LAIIAMMQFTKPKLGDLIV